MSVAPPKHDGYWKEAYWDMIYRRGLPYEAVWWQLNELNQKQAAILMEYSLCYRVVGDTVYLDAKKLKHLIMERHNERHEREGGNVERPSLRSSRYL